MDHYEETEQIYYGKEDVTTSYDSAGRDYVP